MIPEPIFKLKNPESKEQTLIFLTAYWNYNRFKYSTGIHVSPQNWKDGKVTQKDPLYRYKNADLRKLSELFSEVFYTLRYGDPQINKEVIKKALDAKIKGYPEQPSLTEFLKQFIREMEQGKSLTPSGGMFSEWTVKGYRSTLSHLKGFEKSRRLTLKFENMTGEVIKSLVTYFNSDLGQAKNTVAKNIKNINALIREAKRRGIHTPYQGNIRVSEEETDQIYLTDTELKKIKALNLPDNLDRIRDLFLVGCYTGARFADLKEINRESIFTQNGKSYVRIRAQKTGEIVVIPVRSGLLEILQKYDFKLPRILTNQAFNRELKGIARKAGVTDQVRTTITRGGRRETATIEKCEMVTTHTARRSFASNMFMSGIDPHTIMKITGHRTERAFLKYIRVSPEEVAQRLSKHPHFK